MRKKKLGRTRLFQTKKILSYNFGFLFNQLELRNKLGTARRMVKLGKKNGKTR